MKLRIYRMQRYSFHYNLQTYPPKYSRYSGRHFLGAVLSTLTDSIFEHTGLVPGIAEQKAHGSPAWYLSLAIIYRSIYTVLSGWLSARLAPNNPMRYAIILGIIAVLANLGGTIAMWSIGQHWYPIILTVLAFPSAWLGGKLYVRRKLSAPKA
ncbi:MAG: hypothetical protein JWM56_298 [Candidatus Peribacteria bacterium]|nr:hypothetical protein [Candidatus Peribacteria bacterium]